jgi:integrase
MPTKERFPTKYAGVYFIETVNALGKPDRAFYIRYRRRSDGKMIEEKAGYAKANDLTQARVAKMRSRRIDGEEPSNEERRAEERAAKAAEEGRWTISRLWKEYKANHPGLKGLATDQNRFDNYIEPEFGRKEPHELVALDIKRLSKRMLKKRAPATVRNVLELLRRIINFGVKTQLCGPLKFQIEMPKVSNFKTEDLTPEQLTKLLGVIEEASKPKPPKKKAKRGDKGKKTESKEITYSPAAAAMMKLVLFTGLRRGELFRLKWEHVDFQRAFITLVDPKGGQNQRVPMNEDARKLLKQWPRTKSPFVFPGRKGRQRTDIKHQVNNIKKAAGLPKEFRALHGLRHVYASMLASSGKVDLYTLQKLMTHKSPLMTQRYAHLRDDALKKAANLAGRLIKEAESHEERDKRDNRVKKI